VSVPDASKTVLTNERGAFRLNGISAGTHRVVVRHVGYGALDTPIAFAPNQTVDRRILLSRVVVLDSVVSTARSNLPIEFEENRRLGLGHFFTREELAKQEGRTLPAVLAQVRGMG